MKKLFGCFVIGIFSLVLLTACNKAKSDNSGLLALLGLGGGSGTFTKVYGSITAENSALVSEADAKIQYLYLASEIGGSGYITKIRVQQGVLTSGVTICNNVTIKMGHTDLTVLGTTWADNVETGQGSEVTVIDNKTITIPAAAADSWVDIALDTPFCYNGKDNLIVDIEKNSGCSADVPTNFTNVPDRVAADIVADSISGTAEWNPTAALDTYSDLLCMQFVFAGGDNHIIFDATPTTNALFGFGSSRSQMLYTKDEINGSGTITGIGFILGADNADDDNPYTVSVSLGHTSASELGYVAGTTTWDTYCNAGSPVVVANAVSFKVPAGSPAGTCLWLPLQSSFNYNGTDNLILDITVTGGDENTFIAKGDILNRRLYGTTSDPGFLGSTAYNTRFRFKGGTADVIGSGNHDLYPPFHGSVTGQFQPLYMASELGLNGSIKSIGFRLQNDSVAESYGNISIAIGHSDLATLALGPLYLDNMYGEKTVFIGTVTVPDGLKAGDWVDIPLDAPFKCTPGKNLAIYVRHDAGASGIENFVQGENDSDRYPGRLLGTENQILNEPGWVADILPSIRLGLK